jgi:hypothetical protein
VGNAVEMIMLEDLDIDHLHDILIHTHCDTSNFNTDD